MLIPFGILSAAGAGGGAVGDYELIQTYILGSSQSTITFDVSSYASTYKHLQLRMVARKSDTSAVSIFRFNGVSSASYSNHSLFGNGSTVTSQSGVSETSISAFITPTSAFAANVFGPNIMDILDPFSSSKNTTVRYFAGAGTAEVSLRSGLFNNTASITSFTITTASGDFVTGSRFSIYGIRG